MTASVRLDLGVPQQRFSVTVQHSTPRVPNPLESALIHILVNLGDLPHYRERGVARLFDEMLGIPEPELWLEPVLAELTGIRLLTCTRPPEDAAAVVLGDLALTERGRQMIATGRLLGRPQRVTLDWCWDPIACEVRSPERWDRLQQQAPALALPATAWQTVFPLEAFRADLVNHSWYRDGETEIEAVTPGGTPGLAWEVVAVEAVLDGTRLSCTTSRPALRTYLQDQDDPGLTAGIAAAVFGPGLDGDDWLLVAPEAGARILGLPQVARRLVDMRQLAYDTVAYEEFGDIEQGPAGGLRIHYAADGKTEEVTFSAEHGHVIVSGRTMPLAACSIAGDGLAWRLCRVEVRIGKAMLDVPVALELPGKQRLDDPELALALLATRDPLRIGAALRFDAVTAWPVLLQSLRTSLEGWACLEMVQAWLAELALLAPEVARTLDRSVLHDVFREALQAHGRIGSVAELAVWRTTLQALGAPGEHDLLEALLQAARPATSIAVLHGMTDEARRVDKDYCMPDGPASYSPALIAELLGLGTIEQVERALRNPNAFERGVRMLWKEGAALARMLGTAFPPAPPVPNALAKILRERRVDVCIAAITGWRVALDELYLLVPGVVTDPASPFETSRAALQEWHSQLLRASASDTGSYDHVFVADTNALINMPDLPLRMSGNVLLVLPLVVLEELDRKKTDPLLRPACAQAVRLLRDMPDSRRRFEESDLSRLPSDFKGKADNRILSVAMKYHHPNLRLITNDEIMTLAAESMKIVAVKVERFGTSSVNRFPGRGGRKEHTRKGAVQ